MIKIIFVAALLFSQIACGGPVIPDGSILKTKLAPLGQQISSSSGLFGLAYTDGTTPVDVTNLSVTITTTGRPVFLALTSDGSGTSGQLAVASLTTTIEYGRLLIKRDTTNTVYTSEFGVGSMPTGFGTEFPGGLSAVDVPSSGTHTYKVQLITLYAGGQAQVLHMQLVAFEL